MDKQSEKRTTTNDNGYKIVDFCSSKYLIISSTYFPKKIIYKHLWTTPKKKTKSQIDYIIIDKGHKTLVCNRNYRVADGGTNYCLVFLTLVLKLSVKCRSKRYLEKTNKLDIYYIQKENIQLRKVSKHVLMSL